MPLVGEDALPPVGVPLVEASTMGDGGVPWDAPPLAGEDVLAAEEAPPAGGVPGEGVPLDAMPVEGVPVDTVPAEAPLVAEGA
jgi:hypothetical protein